MSVHRVLPVLIDGAKAERDRAGTQVRQAAQALQQAQDTHERLAQFRTDYLSRSPAHRTGAFDPQALTDYQAFLARLDQAIGMQVHQKTFREEQLAGQQQMLVQAQRRVMAFEALARRAVNAREKKLQRRAQVEADEFATRSAARQIQENTP